jgi:hypothetical protein
VKDKEVFMTRRSCPAILFIACIIIACSAWGFSTNEVTPKQWGEDLDFLGAELPKRHKNLFHNISESEFRSQINELKATLLSMDQDEILVGLMKIVASVGDSHTTLGYRPQQALPLMLYWFKDGIAILNTTSDYKEILYGKITELGGTPIEDVVNILASIIPHENEAQIKNKIPSLLTDTVILHGMKLIPTIDKASLTVLSASGRKITTDMKPISFSSKPDWLVDTSDESDAPLYLRNRQKFYWYTILPDTQTLFFKYNACQNMTGQPFGEFVKKLFDSADTENVRRLVIDLRHNGGGNSGIFAPFLQELKKRPKFLQKGSIYVVIGRRTFSSAILNAIDLNKQTPAIFVGEPTGGKPNHYGEVKMFRLPQSGIPVTYSVKYFRVIDGDPESLVPDILIEPSIKEYLKKADPALEYVVEKRNPSGICILSEALLPSGV